MANPGGDTDRNDIIKFVTEHGSPTPDNYDALESVCPSTLSELDRLYSSRDWHQLIKLAMPLMEFFYVRGYWDELIVHAAQAAEAADSVSDLNALAHFRFYAMRIARSRGEYEKAWSACERCLQLYHRLEVSGGIAATLCEMGRIMRKKGDASKARQYYEQALTVAQEAKDTRCVAGILEQMGSLDHELGAYVDAKRHYEESISAARKINDAFWTGIALHQLGKLAYDQQKYDIAEQCFQESLVSSEALGNTRCVAATLARVALLKEREGHVVEAVKHIRKAEKILSRLRARPELVNKVALDKTRIESKLAGDVKP